MEQKFKFLDKPIRIGNMIVKNRLSFPPMNTNFANESGGPTKQMVNYYARRAKGGAGLVTVENVAIVNDSIKQVGHPKITEDRFIPMWARMTDKIHRYGAKVSVELAHNGAETTYGKRVSSSDVSIGNFPVHPLSKEEIWEIEDEFANAARRCQIAGFDAVTLHGCHSNLIAQFLSPVYNKRTDCYGGTIINRTRFVLEVVEKIRKAVGPGFPIIMRMSGDEYLRSGLKIEDTVEIAKLLEKGGIDAIDVSGGQSISYHFSIAPSTMPGMCGLMMPNAKKIKESISVPVIGAGGIRDPYHADNLIEEGYADIICFGRSFIADPDFGIKSFKGKIDDVRPCLSCQNCFNRLSSRTFMTCTVNAETGREDEYWDIKLAQISKNVLVIGGGAAGMEAARVSALRGHKVKLVEKNARLGGTLPAASIPPHKENISSLVEWYERELNKLGVEIQLNTTYNDDMLKGIDAVIFAGGASYVRRIPGSERSNVITAIDALTNPDQVGEKIVIIGGGASGCETAEYFGACEYELDYKYVNDFEGTFTVDKNMVKDLKNKDVTIIEMLHDVGTDMDVHNQPMIKLKLKENGVNVMTSTKVLEVKEHSVCVINTKNCNVSEVEADTIILAGGLAPVQAPVDIPDDIELYVVGDSQTPGKICAAVYQAYSMALEI